MSETRTDCDTRERAVSLDVVIPIYNEEAVLDSLFQTLEAVFCPGNMKLHGLSEICYRLIDDGSRDNSAAIIQEHIEQGAPAILHRFSRNFGHQPAVTAGLDNADADLVAVIDADLQDPPELILDMISRWRAGADVVYARRKKRKENAFKRLGYWAFYRLLAFFAEIPIPLDSGDFCLMDRRVVEEMKRLPESLRFVRGLRAWVGFRQEPIDYERPARRAGETKYSFRQLYELATNGLASCSIRPLRLLQTLSMLYLFLSAVAMVLLLLPLVLNADIGISPSTALVALLIVSGNLTNSLGLYILSAYIGRGYLETKHRPPYVIMNEARGEPRRAP